MLADLLLGFRLTKGLVVVRQQACCERCKPTVDSRVIMTLDNFLAEEALPRRLPERSIRLKLRFVIDLIACTLMRKVLMLSFVIHHVAGAIADHRQLHIEHPAPFCVLRLALSSVGLSCRRVV